MACDHIRSQWEVMLRAMISDYRGRNPDDMRTDRDLLFSLMDHFVARGLVEKRDGKYIIKELV